MGFKATLVKLHLSRKFSIRFLLVLVTVVAVFTAHVVNNRRQQIETIRVLEIANARILYDWQSIPVPLPNGGVSHFNITNDSSAIKAPVWLRRIIGDEYFQSVERITFLHPHEVSDEVLAALKRMKGLRTITLYNDPSKSMPSEEITIIKNRLQSELQVEVAGPFDYATVSMKDAYQLYTIEAFGPSTQ